MANEILVNAGKTLSSNITSDLYASAKKWFKKLDPTGEKLNHYHKGIEQALNKIQIMGMSGPKKITHIYISLKFFQDYRKAVTSIPDQDFTFDADNTFSIGSDGLSFDADKEIKSLGYGHIVDNAKKKQAKTFESKKPSKKLKNKKEALKTLHGVEVFSFIDKHNHLLILGQPGGGKTTFLKYLALVYTGHLLVDKEIDGLIPIYIPLRNYSKERDITRSAEWFLRFAIKCASEISSLSDENLWIEDQLLKGNCLILADGIDEVPDNILPDMMGAFLAFSNKYGHNKYVTTCRSASYQYSLEGFNICEIDDFNQEDINSFVCQWFGDEDKKISQFLNDIKKSNLARDLCKTPLLTTMMCLMYEYNRRIPENRYELYESCIDALMYKWDTFRAIDRSKRIISIPNMRKKYILSNIARLTFDSESIYIRKNHLLSLLLSELQNLDIDQNPEDVLYDIEANMGLIVERTHGIYCFSHLTFHEFFVAISYTEKNELELLLDKTFEKPRYKEVFLLAMEKLNSPDKIAVTLAGRIKYTFLNNESSSRYHKEILQDLLLSQAVISKNVRRLLKEVLVELEINS